MKIYIHKRIYVLAIAFLTISACTNLNLDDIDSGHFGTSLAVPVGSTTIGIDDLLSQIDSSFLNTDSVSGDISIIWQGDTIHKEISLEDYSPAPVIMTSAIELKNYEPFKSAFENAPGIDKNIIIHMDEPARFESDIQIDYNYNDFINDNTIDIEIDSLLMKHGTFSITVDIAGIGINANNPLTALITFPYVTDNGTNIVEHTLYSQHDKIEFSLSNFIVKFEAGQVSMPIGILFTVESHDNALYADKNAAVNLNTELQIAGCEHVYGNVNDSKPVATDHIDFELPELPFLSSSNGNTLKFSDPKMTIAVQSDLYMPLTLTIDSMYAKNALGEEIKATFKGEDKLKETIDRPAAVGDMSYKEIVFDNENGSLGQMLSINPQTMYAKYSVAAGNDGKKHSIKLPSQLNIAMKAEVPLSFDAGTSFTMTDTVKDLDLAEATDGLEEIDIQNVTLFIDITSMMPIALDATAVFIDENGNETYRHNDIDIPSASVGADGTTENATEKRLKLEFTGENISKVLNAKDLVFAINIHGMDKGAKIKLRTTDNLSFKISAFAKAGIKFDINQ